jgi:hypothetical protein
MGLAFGAALACAGFILAVRGTGERGTDDALMATGRLSFLLFWPAYAGGALATLFGPIFQPLSRRGREFGLAFASAHLVHLALVAWLCWIGAVPETGVFVFFGIGVVCIYVLALGSIPRIRRAAGPLAWRILQIFGMNYIAYAFAVDFLRLDRLRPPASVAYLPFAVLSVAGPALVGTALLARAVPAWVAVLRVLPRGWRHPWRR